MSGEEIERQRDEALASRNRYATLCDLAPVALLLIDTYARILDANATGWRLLGLHHRYRYDADLMLYLEWASATKLRAALSRGVATTMEVRVQPLRGNGFDVDVLEDASKDDMNRAVDRLKSKIKPDSVVMLFFGGYGVQVGGESYMIPVDAAIWREADVRRQGFSVESVLDVMKEQGARAKLVVIDASRRNPYERRFRAFSHGLAPIAPPDNALILTSATPDKVAEDSENANSVLMSELLTNLAPQSASGAEAVFNKTRIAITRASDGEQVPSVSSSLQEDVSLAATENAGG